MCIRDSFQTAGRIRRGVEDLSVDDASALHNDQPVTQLFNDTKEMGGHEHREPCLLYTSDAADERSSVDLGGRRIIKKQTKKTKKKTKTHDVT